MNKHPFYIVDVFGEKKYTGNQLAVVLNASDLSAREMQDIAREMHFSETTFVLRDAPRDGGYDVRIFTPASEAPFAGHPTLGTAYVIRQEILQTPAARVILNLQVGQIHVTFADELVWMRQMPPTFGQTRAPEEVALVLNLNVSDFDTRFPIQEVSTGLPFLLVPLKTLDAVRRAYIDLPALKNLIAALDAKMIFLFCAETYSAAHHINARMFGDEYGVAEDPATGSANGCLAGYLARYQYFGAREIDVRVEQGYEIARPSVLHLRAAERAGEIEVSVGGQVIPVARGQLE